MTFGSFARRCGAVLLVGMLTLGAGPLRAASITVDFLAENIQPGDSATTDAAFALLGLARGGSVTGRITFDPTFPDNRFVNTNFLGVFESGTSAVTSFSVTIGATTYETPAPFARSTEVLAAFEGVQRDAFVASGASFFDSIPGVRSTFAELSTGEPDLDRFNGLFRDAEILQAMSENLFVFGFVIDQPFTIVTFVSDQVTFSAVAAVPAPLPAVLLLTGLGGLAMMRRRARRAAA